VNEHGDVFFAPYEVHNRERMEKKDIPMLMRLTNDTFVAMRKGQE